MQLPRTKRDITTLLLLQRAPRAPVVPVPAACGLFTASGNGSTTVEYRSRLFDGENMPRKRLEGRSSERATGWRTLSPVPASKAPCARRTGLTTGRQFCRAASAGAVKEEHGDILCRKETGGCPPVSVILHPRNAPPCRLSTPAR